MKRKLLILLAAGIFACNFSQAQTWSNVGEPGFSTDTAGGTSIAIDNSGTPYVAFTNRIPGGTVTVMKYSGGSWVTVGSPFATGRFDGGYTWFAIDLTTGTPYAVFADASYGDKLSVMKYSSGGWISVGSPGFSLAAYYGNASIATDGTGTPYVTYSCSASVGTGADSVIVMKYNGTSWVNVGDVGPLQSQYSTIAIDGSGSPYIVVQSAVHAAVKKYDGTNWGIVGGATITSSEVDYPVIAINNSGTPYVAFSDWSLNGKASVKKYDGSSWVYVGIPMFSAYTVNSISLAIDGSGTPYVAYLDGNATNKATVMKFDGTSWVNVGSAGFTPSDVGAASIAINSTGTPYVAYSDGGYSYKASVMKFGPGLGVNTFNNLEASFSVFPNPSHGSFSLNVASATTEEATITITNIVGEKLKEFKTVTNRETAIEVEGLSGTYFITAVTEQDRQSTKVVIW